jgi:hypothetical protein
LDNADRYQRAIALIDAANAADPRIDEGPEGERCPRELLYARRMSAMLDRLAPGAGEDVRLAVRAQHVLRWKHPREDYPMDREGYLRWRTALYAFHADTAARLLGEAGYDEATIERVKRAVGKRGRNVHAETQLVEDVACLVFFEHYLEAFAAGKRGYDEAKWTGIVRRTWAKMSPAARAFALSGRLRLPEPLAALVRSAVAGA